MKIFISDSGPIISFSRAGYLDLLQQVINELLIPEAVYREIIRIIKEAKAMELITEVKTIVEEMKDSGLWVKDSLYHQFIKEMGEG
ncbi:MAG: DUF3368 domain-containing protein [bacterium]